MMWLMFARLGDCDVRSVCGDGVGRLSHSEDDGSLVKVEGIDTSVILFGIGTIE